MLPLAAFRGDKPADEIVFVASVCDDNDAAAGLQPRNEVIPIPAPLLVSIVLALCVLVASDWIVNKRKIRAMSGNAGVCARAEEPPAICRFPFVSRFSVCTKAKPQLFGIVFDVIPGRPAMADDEIFRVTAAKHGLVGSLCEQPRHPEPHDVRALCCSWWEAKDKSRFSVFCCILDLLNQQPMMRFWLVSCVAAPGHHGGLDISPTMEIS
jgi:hypothetical protein